MTRLGQGVYAASNARRKWLTSDPTGVNLSASNTILNGSRTNSRALRSSDNIARGEQLSKALSAGYGSVDVLLPRHVSSRIATVDLAGPSYAERFSQLPDGHSAARAAVAIAAMWGSVELRRCQENRLQARRDPIPIPRFQSSPIRKKRPCQLVDKERVMPELRKIALKSSDASENSLDASNALPTTDSGVTPSSNSPTVNAVSPGATGRIPSLTVEKLNAVAWFKCTSSSLFEKDLSDGPLRKSIQSLSGLTSSVPAGKMSALSVFSSSSLLGACFRRTSSQSNCATPGRPKLGESPKLRSVPKAAILARANAHHALSTGTPEPSPSKPVVGNEKSTQPGDITPSTPAVTKPITGVSDAKLKLDFEMKVPSLDISVDEPTVPPHPDSANLSSNHLLMGYKSRLAAPHSHWNKLMKSLEAKVEEVEEAAGSAKKPDNVKSPGYLSAQLIKRKQKLEQRRRLQSKTQNVSGVKRSSSNSGLVSGSTKNSGTKSVAASRRPKRRARLENPIRDWSSQELTSEGDDLRKPARLKRVPGRGSGGTTQSSQGTLSTGSKFAAKERGEGSSTNGGILSNARKKTGSVRKFKESDLLPVSGWVKEKFTGLLSHVGDGTPVEVRDFPISVLDRIALYSKRRPQSSMFAISEISDDSQSYVRPTKSSRALAGGSKIDIMKSARLDLTLVNKFISSAVGTTKFVTSLASVDADTGPEIALTTNRTAVRSGVDSESGDRDEKESEPVKMVTVVEKRAKRELSVSKPSTKTHETGSTGDEESEETKAKGLQQRVCGNMFELMTKIDQEKVKRWAKRNFTDFTGAEDIMEVTLNVKSIACSRCVSADASAGLCEESIVLKLWKDMTWRKVRRLRHVLGSE